MIDTILGLGSNQGDRLAWLQKARGEINLQIGKVISESPVYESSSWGYASAHLFLNQVIVIRSNNSPMEMMELIQQIEAKLGRFRPGYYSDRQVDIDILFYGDEIVDAGGLKIPHPLLSERLFVLMPLAKMCPDKIHPENGLPIHQLLKDCPDKGRCYEFAPAG
jgi:2-amino-4-hydroxy-6-hydroxymethyldihydropteridine diphosphokinase